MIGTSLMTRAEFDSPWKNVLNHFLEAFLGFCLPEAALEIDWTKGYIPLDKELTAVGRRQKIGKRIADTLFKVWLKNGEEVWLLLHIEIQASEEDGFEERIYIYNYRIFDRYQKAVISLAILADDNPNWHPTQYERLSRHNSLNFKFATVKLLDYKAKKETLIYHSNPFALVIWAHLEALGTREIPQQRFQAKLAITRILYERGFDKEYILTLFYFIDWVLALPEAFELEYTHTIEQLEEEKQVNYITSVERIGIQKGRQEGFQKGIQKGLQKGRQEAMLELAINLLREKTLPEAKIAAMTGLSPAVIRALYKKASAVI